MCDEELSSLARQDLLCHHLAQQARLGESGSLESQNPVAGVVNIQLHVMHSLGTAIFFPHRTRVLICLFVVFIVAGVLLGVAIRHGITPHINMSAFFWRLLSREQVNPYAAVRENTGNRKSSSGGGNSLSGRRAQELFSHTREACARALRHGVASVLPEVTSFSLLQDMLLQLFDNFLLSFYRCFWTFCKRPS